MTLQAYQFSGGYGTLTIPNPPISAPRSPTTTDTISPDGNAYQIGQYWRNTLTGQVYFYTGSGLWDLIAGSGVGPIDTLTGNTGGPVAPSSGNINILGTNTTTVSGSGSTLTITPTASGYPVSPFVVGPIGQAGYQTIQSALNAANAAGSGIVVIQPGTYTENLTLYNGINIMGLNFADAGGGVVINGTHTPPTSGGFSIQYVSMNSATNIFNSASAGSAHLVLANAIVNVTNGYTFNLPNWTGKLESFDVNAAVGTNDGYVNNTGGSEVDIFECSVGSGTTNVMTVSGLTLLAAANIYCPMNFITGATAACDYSTFNKSITFSNNSTGTFSTCHFIAGSSAAITMSSSASIILTTSAINSTNNPAIAGSGAGTLTLADITFINNNNIAGTLTTSLVTTIAQVPGNGMPTITVTGTSSALIANTSYTANNSGLVTLTLPSTAKVGDVIQVCGLGSGGWKIAQNASQTIHFNSVSTTVGTGGSLSSTAQYNSVTIRCIVANTDFIVISSEGTLTVV